MEKYSLKTRHKCLEYEKYFREEYYIYNNIWSLHIDDNESLIKLFDYNATHKILGCSQFERLGMKCPTEIIVPMATLLCILPQGHRYKCLYRNQDQGVGIEYQSEQFYLTPTHIMVDNIFGFEDVTIGSPRLSLTSRSK